MGEDQGSLFCHAARVFAYVTGNVQEDADDADSLQAHGELLEIFHLGEEKGVGREDGFAEGFIQHDVDDADNSSDKEHSSADRQIFFLHVKNSFSIKVMPVHFNK